MNELIDAVAQAYIDYTSPLVYLIEKVTESRQKGTILSLRQLEDFVEEATATTCTIIPLHALLSSVKDSDTGKAGDPTTRFIMEVIRENVLVMLRDNMTQAVSRLMRDYNDAAGSPQAIDTSLSRASHAICTELSRIKRLNRGFLPHPDLKELWERFSCRDDFAIPDLN